MRLLVCGGRDYTDQAVAFGVLDGVNIMCSVSLVIHGAARGADTLAGQWAKARGIPELKFPADWKTHRRAAGPIRNQQMLVEGRPDIAVAFPGGTGTADMVARLRQAGIEPMIV